MKRAPYRSVLTTAACAAAAALAAAVCIEPLHAQSSPARAAHRVPELAGTWTGADWGDVVFQADGSGTYTSTHEAGPGRLTVRRAGARMYVGHWGESRQRRGTLALVLEADGRTLRGGWTPDPQSTLGSLTGGSIEWTRRPR